MHRWSLHLIPGTNSKAAPFHVKHDLQVPLNSSTSPEEDEASSASVASSQREMGAETVSVSAPAVVFTLGVSYSTSSDVPGASAPTIRARSSSPANSIVMRPFFAPRVTLTRVSKASESRVDSAGRGVLRARSTFG